MKSYSPVAAALFLIALGLPQPARAQFAELAKRVPGTANALVLVNASKIMQSPAAKIGNWEADRMQRFSAGLTNVPAIADQLVIGAQLDLEAMHPIWEAAIVRTNRMPSLAAKAQELGGAVDSVADLPAVRLPDDSFIVQISPETVGMLAPANRQLLARWIREPSASLSSYLQEAVGYADRGGAVYMALDLRDAVTEADVLAKIEAIEDEALVQAIADKQAVAKVIASIQGTMLGITFGDQAYGKLRVDFAQDVAALGPIVKPLMLHVLGERGLIIDELADWNASAAGTTISLAGPLTASGLTRLSSVIELPTEALHQEAKSAPPTTAEQPSAPGQAASAPSTGDIAQATQHYFQSIEHLFNDLKLEKKDAKTIGQFGQWFDNYARKIDRLPMLDVDEQMLDFGAYVADQLRNASMAIKGIGIRTRAGEVNAVAGGVTNSYSGYRYGRYGGYGGDYSWTRGMTRGEQQSARTQVRANEKAVGAASVQGIRQQIQEATQQIRRAMTEKYRIQF